MSLRVKRLVPEARLPERATDGAAGYDLFALEDTTILGRAVVRTGIAVVIPAGYYGRVAPRSGLAVKHRIDVCAGVIDSDYRGEIGVVLSQGNGWTPSYTVKAGDRIAQLILEKIATPPVEEVGDLDETARGSGGFGSTGV